MANEVDIVTILEDRMVEVTVADGTTVERGTIMKWSSDPNTVAACSADGDLIAGIMIVEKVANDGQTKVPLLRRGVCDIVCTASTGSAVLGKRVKVTGANTIAPADDDTIANITEAFATSMETGSAGERVQCIVDCM